MRSGIAVALNAELVARRDRMNASVNGNLEFWHWQRNCGSVTSTPNPLNTVSIWEQTDLIYEPVSITLPWSTSTVLCVSVCVFVETFQVNDYLLIRDVLAFIRPQAHGMLTKLPLEQRKSRHKLHWCWWLGKACLFVMMRGWHWCNLKEIWRFLICFICFLSSFSLCLLQSQNGLRNARETVHTISAQLFHL